MQAIVQAFHLCISRMHKRALFPIFYVFFLHFWPFVMDCPILKNLHSCLHVLEHALKFAKYWHMLWFTFKNIVYKVGIFVDIKMKVGFIIHSRPYQSVLPTLFCRGEQLNLLPNFQKGGLDRTCFRGGFLGKRWVKFYTGVAVFT